MEVRERAPNLLQYITSTPRFLAAPRRSRAITSTRRAFSVPCAKSQLPRSGRPLMLSRVAEPSPAFDAVLSGLQARGEADFSKAEGIVREILDAVRREGDAAVARYAQRFENRTVPVLFQRDYRGEAALAALPRQARDALA